MPGLKCAGTIAFFCYALAPATAQVTVSLEPGKVNPRQQIMIPLSVSARKVQISGLQWTLHYDATLFSSASFSSGEAAQQAAKTITCRALAAGKVICLVWNLTAKELKGVVANLSLSAAAASGGAKPAITIDPIIGVTPSGDPVVIGSTSAIVFINPNAQGRHFLLCSSTTLTAGDSITCTVALSGVAPAGGLIVALGTTTTGAAG